MAAMTASCGTNDLNPDKGEVGGSSPPRPLTHTSKYAAILTFPLIGALPRNLDHLLSYGQQISHDGREVLGLLPPMQSGLANQTAGARRTWIWKPVLSCVAL